MKKTYCADDKCEFEVYSKEELDNLLESKANSNDVYTTEEINEKLNKKFNKSSILSGTSTPSSSLGNDGDLYFKYE